MNSPRITSVFQVFARDNLKLVFPKNAAGRLVPEFFNGGAKITYQPSQIACLRNVVFGAVPKPANPADLRFGTGAVKKALRCTEVVIEPVKHTAQLVHLPILGKIGTVIKQIIGSGEYTGAAARINVDATRCKADIHEGHPYSVRTFLCSGSQKNCCKFPNRRFGGRVRFFERQRKTWDDPREVRRRTASSKIACLSLCCSRQKDHFKGECVA